MFVYTAFIATFVMIALMEIGDKTQIVVIALASKTKRMGLVAIGSTLGISVVIILGVALGTVLDVFIPVALVDIGGAIIFISIGLFLLIQSRKKEHQPNHLSYGKRFGGGKGSTLIGSALAVGLMEFGDKTQVATITLAATYDSALSVALGAILAEAALMVVAAFIGAKFITKIRRSFVDLLSSMLFIVAGLLMIVF